MKRILAIALLVGLSAVCLDAEQWYRWGRPRRSQAPSTACGVGDVSGCVHYTIAQLFASATLGGFCAPVTADGASQYIDFQQQGIAHSATGLYIADESPGLERVFEISIPARVYATSASTMNYATFLQNGVNPTLNGATDMSNEADEGTSEVATPSALLVYNSKLYGTLASNYWGTVTSGSAHYVRSLTLSSTTGLLGLDSFGASNVTTRFSNRFLKAVPLEQVTPLGGAVFAGAGQSWSILSTQSWGPSGCTMNPADIDGTASYHACTMLVAYPENFRTLGTGVDNPPGPHYLESMQIFDGVLIDGTDNMLFFGTKGDRYSAYAGYGPGTSDIAQHGVKYPDPVLGPHQYNYDPVYAGTSGYHAWPYSTWAWNYKLSDMAKVKAGTTNPATGQPWQRYEVLPTESQSMDAFFPIALDPTTTPRRITAAAWKRETRQLILAQKSAGCSGNNPVFWEFILPGTTP